MTNTQDALLQMGTKVNQLLHTQRAVLYRRQNQEPSEEYPLTNQEWSIYATLSCRVVWKSKTRGIMNREPFAEENVVALLYINSTDFDLIHAGDYVEVYQTIASEKRLIGTFLTKSSSYHYTSHAVIPLERYSRFA